MKFLIISALFIFSSPPAWAKVTWFLSQQESSHKFAIVPSYRRAETLGSIVSGRAFIYPAQDHGLYASLSLDLGHGIYGFKQNIIYWTESKNEWGLSSEWSQTFDSYYKKNSTRRLEVPILKRWIKFYYLNSSILKGIHPLLQTGISFEIQNRNESTTKPCILVEDNKKSKNLKSPCQAHNTLELGGVLGWIIRLDSRNNLFDPSSGYFAQTKIQLGKEIEAKDLTFFQFKGRLQFIFSLIGKERWFIQWATGWTFYNSRYSKELPYTFQYKLGGIDYLRGYLKDRWHSGHYYLMQLEWRYPLLKIAQPVIFTDIGQTDIFKPPLITYGAGVRIGLPPSYEQKIRIEYGRSKDQSNFIISFAHPY